MKHTYQLKNKSNNKYSLFYQVFLTLLLYIPLFFSFLVDRQCLCYFDYILFDLLEIFLMFFKSKTF